MSRRATVPGRGQHAERDWQIERRAGLADVGRRQVDGYAVRRKLEAGVADRAAHAVAALAHARVGQADHLKRRQAERDVDFDLHQAGLDPEDGGGPDAGEHRLLSQMQGEAAADFWPEMCWVLGTYAALRAGRRSATLRNCDRGTASRRSEATKFIRAERLWLQRAG